MSRKLLPCPCCGSHTLNARGDYEICPVCHWEDDPAQAGNPELSGGANDMSLTMAREQWKILQDRL